MATRPSKAPRPPKEFAIPLDLLQSFQKEIRFVPQFSPTNGYIVFDMNMLISVLKRGDREALAALASTCEALQERQVNLVMMQPAGNKTAI